MPDEIPSTFIPADEAPPSSGLFSRANKGAKAPRDSTPKQPKPPVNRSKHNQRKQKLETLLSTVGGAVIFFEQFDGNTIMMHAEDVAEATAALADEVPAVARAIDSMSTGGAYGAFFIALSSMLLPILAHHNIIPAFLTAALVPNESGQSAA